MSLSQRRGDEAEFSIGFLTALVSDELIHCEAILAAHGWEAADLPELSMVGIKRWVKSIDGRVIAAYSMAIGTMGQTASALETMAFLGRCRRPSIVFLTGIAGSLREDKVYKGDVVVARSTRWRTQNKIFGDDGCDQYRPFDNILRESGASSDISRLMQRHLAEKYPHRDRNAEWQEVWNAHYGEIYTWDYVINSQRVVRKINADFPESLCVEMEAGGFLGALDRARTMTGDRPMHGYVVRGISDYAARKDKEKNVRASASKNAAEVAVGLAELMCRQGMLARLGKAALQTVGLGNKRSQN
ncbi:5'-methylthioadenosine/S-adenosylhomocysteine nucleosidase [Rhizobium ruizarguesonis]|uniref:5'-methylthioadenosine/S-adenosylhomocysteine nucleosidase family protein n=1 Tax=Rhizobium ruizarguesonis TaxID=2081791 RepID=UPI0013EE42DC|nr:5'-methylthioadenosine/S-adenosylhomocysteine nucleosidase [Rhizobium ruizarguesonis]